MEAFGYIGGVLLGIQLFPQIYKTWTIRDAEHLSLGFMLCNLFGLSSMGVYTFYNKDYPILIPICVSTFNSTILIFLKLYFTKALSV